MSAVAKLKIRRGSPDGPVCTIVVDERWREGLSGLAGHKRIQVL